MLDYIIFKIVEIPNKNVKYIRNKNKVNIKKHIDVDLYKIDVKYVGWYINGTFVSEILNQCKKCMNLTFMKRFCKVEKSIDEILNKLDVCNSNFQKRLYILNKILKKKLCNECFGYICINCSNYFCQCVKRRSFRNHSSGVRGYNIKRKMINNL